MLSFESANDFVLSGGCPIPLLKCIDYATASNVTNVVLLWFALTAAYHMLVSFMAGGDCELNFRQTICWKAHLRSGRSHHCRFARFYRCQKRTQRRHKFASDKKNDQCPIARMFCSHPPPLPFHRRRKCMWSSSEQTDTSSDESSSSDGSHVEEVTTEVTNESTQNRQLVTKEDEKKHKKSRRKSQVQRPLVGPLVLDLARMQRWTFLEERLQIARREAKDRDAEGLYPLHWACSGGPPVSVVQALLNAYPRAARRVDADGSTALHMASHYGGSAAVVETLIEAHPPAVRVQDRYGRTPLYHATKKRAGLDVLRALLKAAPEMSTVACAEDHTKTSNQGQLGRGTPLYVVWVAVLASLKSRRQGKSRDWDKAVLLLQAAYMGYVDESDSDASLRSSSSQRSFKLLHAAIALDAYLPEEVVPHLLEHHPEHARQPDEDGRLPLAIAAELTHVTPDRSNMLISILLRAYPQAAHAPDINGRSPLALALASGKRWDGGVERLFLAAPDRLFRRDLVTGLPPAILAATAACNPETNNGDKYGRRVSQSQDSFGYLQATSGIKARELHRHVMTGRMDEVEPSKPSIKDEEDSHVSTVFELLQANPAVLHDAVP